MQTAAEIAKNIEITTHIVGTFELIDFLSDAYIRSDPFPVMTYN